MNASELRVSHTEREPSLELLQQAYAEGRLDHDEFDQRIHLAMTAKTFGDLELLTRDLRRPVRTPYAYEPEPTGEDRMLAGLAHASGVVTLFLGPLLFLVLSGKRSPYVRRHAAAALNFQLTLLLIVVCTFGVGAILFAVTWLIAAIAALSAIAQGTFRYPFTLSLIK
jgi:uncharacterized Tic20 family protein